MVRKARKSICEGGHACKREGGAERKGAQGGHKEGERQEEGIIYGIPKGKKII